MTPDPINAPQGGEFVFPTEQEMAGVPDRNYRAQVATCELATSKSSGNLMWRVKLEIIEPAAYQGRFIYDNITFSAAAAGLTFSKLKTLGVGVQAGHGFNPSGGAHRDIIGRKVEITTKLEEYNGQMNPKVASMRADPGPGGLRELPSRATQGAHIQPSSASPSAPRSSTQVAEKQSSEELPF